MSLLAQLVMAARFFAHLKSRWVYGLTYPIACIIVAALLVKAMFKQRPAGKITWRDTVYSLNQRAPGK